MKRIIALDIARGLAIVGTLATNIWIFSHPEGMLGYLNHPTSTGAPPAAQATEALLQQLANGKFLGLLTLLFGIGLAIQYESAQRRDTPWLRSYGIRAAILFADALLHYLLVVEFDILMGYAITGIAVAYVLQLSQRWQRRILVVAGVTHLCLVGAITAALWNSPMVSFTLPSNPYRDGTWWDLVLLRIDLGVLFRFEPVFIFWLGVFMFLSGAWLYRSGIFDDRGGDLRRVLMWLGAGAFVLDMAAGLAHPGLSFITRYCTAPLVAFGLLAWVAHTWGGQAPGFWARRCAEIGRVALSAYILQNLIASALFYGWGCNLGSLITDLRLPVTVAAWCGISALLAALAHVWLRHFSRGPFEWLWNKTARAFMRAPLRPQRVNA